MVLWYSVRCKNARKDLLEVNNTRESKQYPFFSYKKATEDASSRRRNPGLDGEGVPPTAGNMGAEIDRLQ